MVRQNDQVEQLTTNRHAMPQDAIASLLQRMVRHAQLYQWQVQAVLRIGTCQKLD